ncbi:MAG: phospho-sugar mutase, partial [Peptostreptococcus porci]|nr:phospho-sugar mutase [Peptostreptococcus porci]
NKKVVELLDFEKGVEGFTKSNVLKYVLEDGSWVALRPSGTEPKIKVYIGTKDSVDDMAIEKVSEIEEYFLKEINAVN